jgi:hypothetical protein
MQEICLQDAGGGNENDWDKYSPCVFHPQCCSLELLTIATIDDSIAWLVLTSLPYAL